MSDVLKLIGNTPLVEIRNFDTGLCRLFVKLESQNPGGSIKDRIALGMIAAAEKDGALKPGGTIIEATAGNTGLGLALVAALKGYKIIIVMPDKMSREKALHCKALGADVHMARSDVGKGHPEYYQDVAERIARETGAFYVNQFANPVNTLTHETTTAPEIWEQMEHDVDAVVCGVGSGGTLTGLGNFFKRVSPKTEMVLADPAGSILEPLVNRGEKIQPGSWVVEGIGEDFIPPILDLSLAKKAYSITDEESVGTARALLLKEGILAGPSSGTLFAAALRYCREQKTPKRVVTLVCDRGDKYLSKTFSDFWMTEQGFTKREKTNTVEDLIIRRHDQNDTVIVRPNDTLLTAYKRMRVADVSQLPVVDERNHFIGIVDEAALLDYMARAKDSMHLDVAVRDIMRAAEPKLPKTASLDEAAALLQKSSRIIITDGETLLGMVTRVDLLNHFVLKAQSR
ncbi:MAG: pyridoxal-phosphate dependent enzyme [Alphaproteobacteria bacterium]|nr:pyridoxal-phosphate dependent enzyme [Alphaproteobacteria bacterium]